MRSDNKEKLIFLFGAGASAEAGVCTTEKITEILVNYGSYSSSGDSTSIENLLKYIQVKIADYLQTRASDVNFEYILGTLMELSKRGEYPIVPFLGEGDLLVRKLEERISLTAVIDRLYSLLRELLFIRDPVEYFHPLKSFLPLYNPLDFFTLNYDLSLEMALEDLNVVYTTGYKQRKDQLAVWDPSEFEKRSLDVRIFKLHGSINWGQFFMYPPPPARSEPYSDVIRAAEYYMDAYPESVEFNPFPIAEVHPPEGTRGMVSIMNFGTRKELLYSSSQFTVLFHHFLSSLQTAKTCVVAGYSFRDDRINKAIVETVIRRRGNLNLVIVNPSVFRVTGNNPILWKIFQLEWAKGIDKGLGEALSDGSLYKAVEESLQRKRESREIVHRMLAREEESGTEKRPVNAERILETWKILGTNFDLTYFWMEFLGPELRRLYRSATDSEAIRVGQILLPLIRKVRDLCHQIRWVYEEMGFGGTYGEEYLNSIIVRPRVIRTDHEMELVRKKIGELGNAVSYAVNVYNNATEEFRIAVRDPEYGKRAGAPSHLAMAGLVIRKTKSCIYGLACTLNDIYRGVGYEEPFKMIAEHQEELVRERYQGEEKGGGRTGEEHRQE